MVQFGQAKWFCDNTLDPLVDEFAALPMPSDPGFDEPFVWTWTRLQVDEFIQWLGFYRSPQHAEAFRKAVEGPVIRLRKWFGRWRQLGYRQWADLEARAEQSREAYSMMWELRDEYDEIVDGFTEATRYVRQLAAMIRETIDDDGGLAIPAVAPLQIHRTVTDGDETTSEQQEPDEPLRSAPVSRAAANGQRQFADTPPKPIPEYDRHSGDWCTSKEAAIRDGIKSGTLGKYRQRDICRWIAEDSMSGIDCDGRMWRRVGTRNSHPHYHAKTLKCNSQKKTDENRG